MGKFIIYTTQANDRWDKIAYKYYGDVYRQKELIEANSHIPLKPILEEGLKIKIPILEPKVEVDKNLPIWKAGI